MSATDNDDATAPGEAIDDYASLKAQQQTIHRWKVLNMNGGKNSFYTVNTEKGTCSCPADKYSEDDEPTACKHLAYVLSGAGQSLEMDTALYHHATNVLGDVREAAEATMTAAEAMGSGPAADATSTDSNASDDDQGGSDDDGDVVTDGVGADDNQQQLVDKLSEWFDDVSDTMGFDGGIIELEWGTADDDEGVVVSREPFAAGYWDDGDWQDKEGYEEQRDKADDVMSNRDEFDWYGEPDYVYFVEEADIMEVLG